MWCGNVALRVDSWCVWSVGVQSGVVVPRAYRTTPAMSDDTDGQGEIEVL